MSDAAIADCESLDGWLWQQEVNGWSSLAYVLAGAVIGRVAWRSPVRGPLLLLAALVGLEGVGSLVYHGRPGDLAQALHDIALLGILGFLAGWHVARLGAGSSQRPMRAAAATSLVSVGAGVGAWGLGTAAVNALVGLAVLVIVAAEVVARRRRLGPVWTVGPIALTAVAVLAWLAGRPESPLCDADSWAQPHGLWHVLTALVALTWVDRALDVSAPDAAPRLWRSAIDRSMGLLAMLLARAFHRSIDVVGRERFPVDRPVLLVANHANGFVDPIVVAAALRRVPRFLAKAALWKVLPARPLLAFAGVLPVYRSSDGDTPAGNDTTFAACYHELARGSTVAIFPEGTTGDRGGLDRVRSGAARIAIGAAPAAPGLVIVPVGLAFESRVATRTRALIMVGEPIPVEPLPPDVDGRQAAAELTATITRAMASISPAYSSREERDVLRAAAGTSLGTEPTFGETELLARRVAAAPDNRREHVVERYRRYASEVHVLGLSERDVRTARLPWRRLVTAIALLLIAGPLLLTATLVHLPALLLTVAATRAVRSSATKGTVRILVGLVTGLATWLIAGFVLADGVRAIGVAALVAAGGALALAVWEPAARTLSVVLGRLRVYDRVSLLGPALEARRLLAEAVDEASR